MHAATASATVRTIAATARDVGAELPADLLAAVEHLDRLEAEPRALPSPAAVATDLARHLGDPAAMDKARAKAAADLATAEANAKLTGALVDRCALVLQQRVRRDRETIAAAFAAPLAAALDTLTETAPLLPPGFAPDEAADLDAATFTAWTRARDAHVQLEAVGRALAPVYGGGPVTDLLPAPALAALRYTAPPAEFTDPPHAHRFADALAGNRYGGGHVGPVSVRGVFAPTACAELGATFAWATPAEVARRAEAITAAATPPVVERGGRQAKAVRIFV
jgi:hypothetical protein